MRTIAVRGRPWHAASRCVAVAALMSIPSDAGAKQAFRIVSSDLMPGRSAPLTVAYDRDGCHGRNLSPEIVWRGVPRGTRSMVVTLFDPDERSTGSGWWHWLVYDISPSVRRLERGVGRLSSPKERSPIRHGISDLGERGYHGPCPSVGDAPHRYILTVYAIRKFRLPVPVLATGAMVTTTARSIALGSATMVVRYAR